MKKLFCLILLVGCASKVILLKEQELLPYKESAQVTRLDKVNKALFIAQVRDKREEKTFGHGYTGVRYDKTPVIFDVGINNLVQEHVVDALEIRNIMVKPGSDLKMTIDVHELRVDEIIEKFQPEKAKCKIKMTFHVESEKIKWSGNFWTSFTSAGDMSEGTERLAPTLGSCFNEIIEKLVNDNKFQELLE
ncbi:MAG: YajG family lipoprotein [Bacteriovoracaceae bacterium]|nr:YajG family lipoprotein [Bacteriovoracaceae bacterium]